MRVHCSTGVFITGQHSAMPCTLYVHTRIWDIINRPNHFDEVGLTNLVSQPLSGKLQGVGCETRLFIPSLVPDMALAGKNSRAVVYYIIRR